MNFAALKRAFNPRYSWLPRSLTIFGGRIVDVGAGPLDGQLAKKFWPGCYMVGVNIEPEPVAGGFDEYHQIDLNKDDLSHLPASSFDYVVSSHLIEHIDDGMKTVDQMADLVCKGGLLYLEWPSEHSTRFPIKGVGLNFFDDETHVRTYSVKQVVDQLQAKGFEIISSGPRHHIGRMLLAPALCLRRSLAEGRLRLYDLWDYTGFCIVVRARRLS
jgi:SAM-dependent methyltransferase